MNLTKDDQNQGLTVTLKFKSRYQDTNQESNEEQRNCKQKQGQRRNMTNLEGENDGRTEITDFNVDCEVTGGRGDARLQTRSNAEKTKHIYIQTRTEGIRGKGMWDYVVTGDPWCPCQDRTTTYLLVCISVPSGGGECQQQKYYLPPHPSPPLSSPPPPGSRVAFNVIFYLSK